MLKHLSINNYALIEHLEIDFSEKLNIITGETGAGKSILLGALSLILGQRADSKELSNKNKKCIIEATFQLNEKKFQSFFSENDIDFESESILRREINRDGKSRAFVNDTPVKLSTLKELGSMLVDVHSQREHQSLLKPAFQLAVLDAYAQNSTMLNDYKNTYNEFKRLETKLTGLMELEKESNARFDYLKFQFNELEEVNPQPNEQEELEKTFDLMTNSENIKAALNNTNQIINNREGSVLEELKYLLQQVGEQSKHHEGIGGIYERLNSTIIELDDINRETELLNNEIEYDQGKIQITQERLDAIYRLQNKHQVNTTADLIATKESIEGELNEITSLEDQITNTSNAFEEVKIELEEKAQYLSESRNSAISSLEEEIYYHLTELKMGSSSLKINLEQLVDGTYNTNGKDSVSWLFSANPGHPYKPLNQIASGGELSRIMLAIKASTAKVIHLPTLIFDEIDTGVS
ncbi:MAG: AAA family ATPase, partial [Bacteroidia bacterium]|nr:AAA family ATPase [Bacteroidia bacterium]